MQLLATAQKQKKTIAATHRLAADKSHIRLTYVTHFYLNQTDATSVMDLLKRYETYSPALLDLIQFVIVDDGSPLTYDIPDLNLNLLWLKITDDIPWNQAGARNLGVIYAPSDKVLITDLDHEFPEETLRYMVQRGECGRHCYRIFRQGARPHPHPNIFLISRARFLRFYGYDEEFSGHYGAEDYRFVKIQKYHGTRFIKMNRNYRCFERKDINRETAYHSLERDLRFNTPIDARKNREILEYGPNAGHSRLFLNFSWRVCHTYHRQGTGVRKKRPLWKHFWHWRWVFGYK
ncbi:MAG: glycosyltransferase [Desulfobacterales bacterium]|nr:glycosyltransferase [Desulfobacterales bacterium]